MNDTKRKRQDIAKRQRDRDISDLKKVLSMPEGRRLLWRVLSETKYFSSAFATDSRVHAFNEGKRDIGVFLYKEINHISPKAFEQMQSEMKNLAKIELKQYEEINNEQRAEYGNYDD